MPRVAVLGNIGSGKTELAEALADRLGWRLAGEPVQVWRADGFLAAFYDDPNRYALAFQQYAFATRRLEYSLYAGVPNVVFDSHVATDPAFVAANVDTGGMTQLEASWYARTYDAWERFGEPCAPDLYLFLAVAPQICRDRASARGREEETAVPLSYFEALDRNLRLRVRELEPRIEIDGSLDKEKVLEAAEAACRELLRSEDGK